LFNIFGLQAIELMTLSLVFERHAVLLINPPVVEQVSKKLKQAREKLSLSERLAQLDWASHN
jgi:hypothetical protein